MNAIEKLRDMQKALMSIDSIQDGHEQSVLNATLDILPEIIRELENPWRPISEAPRDEDFILVCNEEYGNGTYGGFQSVASFWVDRWVFSSHDNIHGLTPILLCFEPTHYMPLPAAPVKKEGE